MVEIPVEDGLTRLKSHQGAEDTGAEEVVVGPTDPSLLRELRLPHILRTCTTGRLQDTPTCFYVHSKCK